nr:hypothetical protein Iba_chr06cCG0770 [Ipomoea batatas]
MTVASCDIKANGSIPDSMTSRKLFTVLTVSADSAKRQTIAIIEDKHSVRTWKMSKDHIVEKIHNVLIVEVTDRDPEASTSRGNASTDLSEELVYSDVTGIAAMSFPIAPPFFNLESDKPQDKLLPASMIPRFLEIVFWMKPFISSGTSFLPAMKSFPRILPLDSSLLTLLHSRIPLLLLLSLAAAAPSFLSPLASPEATLEDAKRNS